MGSYVILVIKGKLLFYLHSFYKLIAVISLSKSKHFDGIFPSIFGCMNHIISQPQICLWSQPSPQKSQVYSSISIAKISYIQANTHTIWGVTPRFSGEPGSCGSGECFGDANPSIPLCMGGEQTLTGVILSGCGVLTSWGSIC